MLRNRLKIEVQGVLSRLEWKTGKETLYPNNDVDTNGRHQWWFWILLTLYEAYSLIIALIGHLYKDYNLHFFQNTWAVYKRVPAKLTQRTIRHVWRCRIPLRVSVFCFHNYAINRHITLNIFYGGNKNTYKYIYIHSVFYHQWYMCD